MLDSILRVPPDAIWHRVVTTAFDVDYPPGWPYEVIGSRLQGKTPFGEGMISIVASKKPPLTGNPNIAGSMRNERSLGDAARVNHDAWNGWRQDFEYRVLWGLLGTYRATVVWLYKEPTLVVCQMRDTRRRLAIWTPVIDRIIHSLEIKSSL